MMIMLMTRLTGCNSARAAWVGENEACHIIVCLTFYLMTAGENEARFHNFCRTTPTKRPQVLFLRLCDHCKSARATTAAHARAAAPATAAMCTLQMCSSVSSPAQA